MGLFFQKGELRLLWPIYLQFLFANMFFFFPTFHALYFRSLGFSFFQIGLFWAIENIASLLFEVPTGAFADLYGRKRSVILGYLLQSVATLLILFSVDFYVLGMIHALWGIGSAFQIGAIEAWVVDLLQKKNPSLLTYYFTHHRVMRGIGLTISGFLGAIFVNYSGLGVIWIFASIAYTVAALLLMFGKEHFKKIDTSTYVKDFMQHIKSSFTFSLFHPVIFSFLMAAIALIFARDFSSLTIWTPLL
ncbi:MAG: MFS transporter, partial [Nanoarchaeota archaeon]